MSTLSYPSNIGFFDYLNNHGISDDAKSVTDQLSEVKADIKRESITMGKSFSDLQDELDLILDESQDNNWDGYGSKAVIYDSYLEAQKFVDGYPISSMVLPEVSIDPDGEISFEWYKNPEYCFSISFSGDEILTYAGLFGINKINGSEYFGDEIPEIILENIKRVYS
ncbi:MAG: hypothetical protein WDZ80_07000 [Candidatus Paceibacterota bacterium]